MKYTAITDGGKYGVQPTMEKPESYDEVLRYAPAMRGYHFSSGVIESAKLYQEDLLTLPRYLRTQGLELLPDGEEFEAREIYQWKGYNQSRWFDCTKEEYEHGGKDFYYRQIVLAPLVKDQDVASVQNDSSPVASHSSASGNSDEQMKKIEDYLYLYLGCEVELTDDYNTITSKIDGLLLGTINDFKMAKPILRPLSSMTEEERSEADDARGEGDGCGNDAIPEAYEFKYLLSNGFDLFGLIEAGLAIPSNQKKINNDTLPTT